MFSLLQKIDLSFYKGRFGLIACFFVLARLMNTAKRNSQSPLSLNPDNESNKRNMRKAMEKIKEGIETDEEEK